MRSLSILSLLVACAACAFGYDGWSEKFETETMSLSGPFAGVISSPPFSGIALYANGDRADTSVTFPTIPGVYTVRVRGASNSASAASVTVLVGPGAATLTWNSSTATVESTAVTIRDSVSQDTVTLKLTTDDGSSDTYLDYVELAFAGAAPPVPNAPIPPAHGAFSTGSYRTMFAEWGKSAREIDNRVNAAFQQLFYGDDSQRVYYPVGTDMAYIYDAGNGDVRSEGMSYGMMICVQLDKKNEFDRIWKWARTYMYHSDGDRKGYFSWQVATNGAILDPGSAPDGEEYFAMALLFASYRWGDGDGIFDYRKEALALLRLVLHHEEDVGTGGGITNLFDTGEKKVVFAPIGSAATFTDPSYHLPSFYKLWARWGHREDSLFWEAAADTSRALFKRAVHPNTGLNPDYCTFDGQPTSPFGSGHTDFRFDAWRTAMNIAMDYAWFAEDAWAMDFCDTLQAFFHSHGVSTHGNQYSLDGTELSSDHSPGLVGMNAVAALAARTQKTWDFVEEFWGAEMTTGKWRYYDGMLYMLALLHMSGNYRIYGPGTAAARSDIENARDDIVFAGRTVTFPAGAHYRICLYNACGRILYRQELHVDTRQIFHLPSTGLPAGTYVVSFSRRGGPLSHCRIAITRRGAGN
jgi:endo-1,4-beta-D-glucanase Y